MFKMFQNSREMVVESNKDASNLCNSGLHYVKLNSFLQQPVWPVETNPLQIKHGISLPLRTYIRRLSPAKQKAHSTFDIFFILKKK